MLNMTVSFICLIMIAGGIRQLFSSLEKEHQTFSFQLFVSIMLLYIMILTGFGMVYLSLYLHGIPVYEEALHHNQLDWVHETARSMYFSGVTLFTVGYGDMIPIGVGRWIAISEAMIGYSLPAALAAKVWQKYKRDS